MTALLIIRHQDEPAPPSASKHSARQPTSATETDNSISSARYLLYMECVHCVHTAQMVFTYSSFCNDHPSKTNRHVTADIRRRPKTRQAYTSAISAACAYQRSLLCHRTPMRACTARTTSAPKQPNSSSGPERRFLIQDSPHSASQGCLRQSSSRHLRCQADTTRPAATVHLFARAAIGSGLQ
jgi:hypothetical protein